MKLRTKNTVALSLFGSALALALAGLSYSSYGSYAELGADAFARPFAAGAIFIFLLFNWSVVRTLTGLRVFGIFSKKEDGRKSVRVFSWTLLLMSPIIVAGPAWIFLTRGAFTQYIAAGGAFLAMVVFYILVPPSDGDLAAKRMKAQLLK